VFEEQNIQLGQRLLTGLEKVLRAGY
jgi:hypothetical protein